MPPADADDSFEAHIAEVERYLSAGEPEHTFGHYCGLETAQFPPVEQLNPEQRQQVIAAFNQLLFSWNLDTDIPDELPAEVAYPLLVSMLDLKTEMVDYSRLTYEFCTYDLPSCPFGTHCRCKDLEEPDDMNFSVPEGELPF